MCKAIGGLLVLCPWASSPIPLSPLCEAHGKSKAIVLEQMMLLYAKAGNKAHGCLDKFIDQRPQGIWGSVHPQPFEFIKSADHDLTPALSWVKSPFI